MHGRRLIVIRDYLYEVTFSKTRDCWLWRDASVKDCVPYKLTRYQTAEFILKYRSKGQITGLSALDLLVD